MVFETTLSTNSSTRPNYFDYNFLFFSIKLNFKSVEKITSIVKYKNIGAYGLVQQNNIKKSIYLIDKFMGLVVLKFIVLIIKNKQGIVTKTS